MYLDYNFAILNFIKMLNTLICRTLGFDFT